MSDPLLDAASRPKPRRAQTGTSISMRISSKALDLIDTAASVLGKSRTEFVLESARQHAIDVLLDQRLFVLDGASHDAFMQALDDPPPPGPKLKALMRRRPLWET